MKLLIVESPGKVKKIQSFLGNDWKVMASVGHVRDLPQKDIGVYAPDFIPKYQATERGKEVLAKLAAEVKKADEVYLATDPDREGEAIAWHLADALILKNPKRVTYTEITESAVKAALSKARPLDMNLVKAQEARRVLDRLVGYNVSPELSNAVGGQLSAGRVQTPALCLVVEREEAINGFKMTTHYGVELTFESIDNVTDGWRAQWSPKGWLEDGQEYFLDQATAEKIAALRTFNIVGYQESESKQAPPAPFTTSTLQQAASVALKMSPKRTMEVAQKVYEGGFVTYMRTDSPNLSDEAIAAIRGLAAQNDWPVPPKPRTWKSKDGAQEAHEAIRPTHFEVEDAGDNDDEKALYRLIRIRALASQLEDALYAVTAVTLETDLEGKQAVFEAKGRRLIKPGWRTILLNDQTEESDEESDAANPVPKLREGSQAVAMAGKLLTKKTRPPARFTEASLVKKLEEMGIGRPSTYAAILDNIVSRKYVEIKNRQLWASNLGVAIIKVLKGHFGFVDYTFTKNLEEKLDDIAEGKEAYLRLVNATFEILEKELNTFSLATGYACPDCGRPLRHMVKPDKYNFWSCSGYQLGECSASFKDNNGKPGERQEKKEQIPLSEFNCQVCGKPLRHIIKGGDGGYDFWSCSGYPDCKTSYKDDGGKPGDKQEKKPCLAVTINAQSAKNRFTAAKESAIRPAKNMIFSAAQIAPVIQLTQPKTKNLIFRLKRKAINNVCKYKYSLNHLYRNTWFASALHWCG